MTTRPAPAPRMILAMEGLRLALRLSQQEFANLLGVSRRSVVRWECGANRPHPAFIRRAEEIRREVLGG